MPDTSIENLLQAGRQFHMAGRAADAENLYRQVLAAQPDHAQALHYMGILAGQTGRFTVAVQLIRRAIAVGGENAACCSNLGKFLMDKGDLEDAAAACRRAVELQPSFAEAHYNLGNVLHLQKQFAPAVLAYREALRFKPALYLAHKNLGTALRDQGRFDEAVAAYGEAARLRPDIAEVHNLLGVALGQAGQHDASIASLREAVRLAPGFAEAWNNLGHALQSTRQFDEAIECYRRAAQLQPDLTEAHNNLGGALKELGRLDESIAAYRRALALRPRNAALHSNLILALNYQVDTTPQTLYEEARAWNEIHARPLASEIKPHINDFDPNRRLRIGYVSADFREHASAFFLTPLLEHHDHNNFEIFCYADVPRPDDITRRFERLADQWRNTTGLGDQRLAEIIREDKIDILIDLKLHADNNRLLVFARKPAPVQATWLGYPGTTGLDAIDYRLTDPWLDPPPPSSADRPGVWYSEESIQLPETFWCYDPLTTDPPVNPLPALQNGHITFGCLNHFAKTNDAALQLWASVLQAVPGSRLMLLGAQGVYERRAAAHREHALQIFQAQGISPDRIEFLDPRPRAEYLPLYHQIDLGLDAWPVNGHTTTLDSLWMGVPVVTLVGPTALGRAGKSQLMNLHLPELIAESPAQYTQIATTLAGDLPQLSNLRPTLRPRMQASPLMDGPRFARNMESAFRWMWRQWPAPA